MLLKGDFVAYKMIRRAVVLNEAACFLREDDTSLNSDCE